MHEFRVCSCKVLSQALNADTAAVKSTFFFWQPLFPCRLLELFFALAPFRLSTAQLLCPVQVAWKALCLLSQHAAATAPHRSHHVKWLLTKNKTRYANGWKNKCHRIDSRARRSKRWCASQDRTSLIAWMSEMMLLNMMKVIVVCGRDYSFCLISFTCQHDVCLCKTETKKVFLPPCIALKGWFIHRENVFIDFAKTYFSGWTLYLFNLKKNNVFSW